MTPSTFNTADEYVDLARRYAESGQHRLAQLAAWSADLHRLDELLWLSGLAQAPDPAAELALIGETVAASIETAAARLGASGPGAVQPTGRAAVEAARDALVSTFDATAHDLLSTCFADLSYLDDAPSSLASDPERRTAARLSGLDAAQLVAELRTAAADCRAMADDLSAGAEPEACERLERQADAAAFEAYLVSSALRAGDDALVTVDLRWDLVAGEHPSAERLASVVGSAERDALLDGLSRPATIAVGEVETSRLRAR